MIFQDPYESLNPRRTIFDTVAEPLKVQNACPPLERMERVSRMLEMVGLTPPATYLFRARAVGRATSGWRSHGRW